MMTKNLFIRIQQNFVKLTYQLTIVVFLALFILAAHLFLPSKKAFAFWTQLDNIPNHPQHRLMTELIQWPNDALFNQYRHNMGLWSEKPDGRKRPWGHGNEKDRAVRSLSGAINNYIEYLKDRQNANQIHVAAEALGKAYHYFEDVGDFSQSQTDNTPLRNAVTTQLYSMHTNPNLYRSQIEAKKRSVQPNLNSIFQNLDSIKQKRISYQASNEISDQLFQIVACLEQVNVYFLNMVKVKLSQSQPPPDKRAWHGGRWKYWATRSDGKRVGEGWFEISYNNGVYSLKATHCKASGCPRAMLVSINNNSLKIKFNDNYDNEMEVWMDSPGTIKGKHWSHKNPNPRYRQEVHNIYGNKVLMGGSTQSDWR